MVSSVEVVNRLNFPFKWITEETAPFQNGDRFEFNPLGINLLFGPNGSGKSTVLKTIAKFTLCNEIGVPHISTQALQDLEDYYPNEYRYYRRDPQKDPGLKIQKDDGLCYYMKSGKLVGTGGETTSYPLDGHLAAAKVSWMNARCSDGQTQIKESDRFIERFDAHKTPLEGRFHVWNEFDKRKVALANERMGAGNGIPTMLLDEPDRNLDHVQSEKLWDKLFSVSDRYQIIVVSHYLPVLLRSEKIRIIPIKDDLYKDAGIQSYLQFCKDSTRR